VSDLPRNGNLLSLAREHVTDQALADHLGVPRTTLRDHIYRLGMREPINVARERPEAEVIPTEIPVIERDYSDESRHYVYPLGDVHLGAIRHATATWEDWLTYLHKRPNASMLGTGDFLNTAIIGSKSDTYDERMTVGEAKRLLIKQLAPLAKEKRLDALMPGNHEVRIRRAIGDCPIRDVADTLEVPYIEAAAMFVYKVGDQTYEVYMRHGTGMGQSVAALAKSGYVIGADVYITGHTHRQAVTADDYFSRIESSVKRRKRYFVSSGSFIGYERYAAERGYPPSRMGAPRILLDGKRRDIHVSI
jgi:hypothetical protein